MPLAACQRLLPLVRTGAFVFLSDFEAGRGGMIGLTLQRDDSRVTNTPRVKKAHSRDERSGLGYISLSLSLSLSLFLSLGPLKGLSRYYQHPVASSARFSHAIADATSKISTRAPSPPEGQPLSRGPAHRS